MARMLQEDLTPRNRDIYPWDKWLNGATWVLKEGTDFTCTVPTLQAQAYQMARNRGLRLVTLKTPGGLKLQVQK
jgi:hypothetical protein